MLFLRQSTASQEVLLGPFVDDTDGKTAETGLTIAASDIRVWKSGGTTEAAKNSGGATHVAAGRYYAVLDATDTDTPGQLELNVHVSGALPVRRAYTVLPAAVYDSLVLGSDKLQVDAAEWLGAAIATPSVAGVPEVDLTHSLGVAVANYDGVAQAGASASITLAASASAVTDFYKGLFVRPVGGTGANQGGRWVTAYNGTTKVATVHAAWAVAPDNTTQYVLEGHADANATHAAGTAWNSGAIGAATLASDTITAAKIAADAVTAAKIADGAIDAGTFAAGAITAAAIATGAIDADAVAADAVAEIQSGLATAAALATVDDFLDTEVAAVVAAVAAIEADTQDLQSRLGVPSNLGSGATVAANLADIEAQTDDIGASGAGLTALPWNAAWDAEVQSEVQDALEANRLHQLLANAVSVPLTNTVAANSALGYLLNKDGGGTYSRVDDSLEALSESQALLHTYLDTEVAAVKAVTDKLDTALEQDGAVHRFTTNALEQAPSGGGGAADWTADERAAIRAILGVPASGSTPADPSAGVLDTIRDYLDTEVAAVKAKTDQLTFSGPHLSAFLADGVAHGGASATLRLGASGATPALYVTNSGGDAARFASAGGDGHAFDLAGHGAGAGLRVTGGAAGAGVLIAGGSSSGAGVAVTANDGAGVSVVAAGDPALSLENDSNDTGALTIRNVNSDGPGPAAHLSAGGNVAALVTAAAAGLQMETTSVPLVGASGIAASSLAADTITAAKVAAGAITSAEAPALANLDAAVSSRLAGAAYAAPDNAGIAAALAALAAITALIDTEVAAVKAATDQLVSAQAEPSAAPAANATPLQKIAWLALLARNKVTETATTQTVFADDGTTPVAAATVSDNGSVFTKGKLG